MKESLLLLKNKSRVDFAYKAGVVSQSDFDVFQAKVEGAWVLVDSLI